MAQSQPALSVLPNFQIDQGLEYYAGKSRLLDWVNRLLDLNLQRLEQLTSGAVYCQILDAFYPDVVAIRKVNFLAREEYEIIPNYKVLQAAFNALGFTKELDVAALSRASTSELMEFAQWLFKNFNDVMTVPDYNPAARRQMSLKGATNTIPLPACLVNSSFEFGRSDLRASGSWSTGTPQEPTKTAPRVRSNSNTPGTSGKSASKRNTPYVNVSSRYREGLAVPPEHYQRSSPRLSPGSGGAHAHRVHMSHGGTQTEFPDEEYRPMTAADVGTEAVSPRASTREFGQQDSFGYNAGLSPADSLVSASATSVTSPGQQHTPDGFSFGPQFSVGAGSDGPAMAYSLSPAASTPAPAPGEGAYTEAAEETPRGDDSADGAAVTTAAEDADEPSSTRGQQQPAEEAEATVGEEAEGTSEAPAQEEAAVSACRASDPDEQQEEEEEQPEGGVEASEAAAEGAVVKSRHKHEDERVVVAAAAEAALPTAFGATAAEAAAAAAIDEADDAVEAADEPVPAETAALGSVAATISVPTSSVDTASKADEQSTDKDDAAGVSLVSSVSLANPALSASSPAGPLTARETTATPLSARDTVASPAAASSASVSAAATPSPRTNTNSATATTAPWRSSTAALPSEIASLLASPVARTRIASASCMRDMAAAIDAAAAALQAADKSLDSFDALLTTATTTTSANGSGSGCSPALCGKARSLQDALQTLLAHTSLLLSDVQVYSEATHPQPFSAASPLSRGGAAPSGGGASGSGRSESVPGAEGAGQEGSRPPRNFAVEAAALLETARSHDSRLKVLVLKAKDVLQLPHPDATTADRSLQPASDAANGSASSSSSASHRHLTDEQRKLCGTGMLDGHLKAVGMAQFALVQDIHKELAALMSSYFRHTGITGGGVGEGSTGGGGEGSTGGGMGGGSTGGVSTSSSRKARVFKLGEYQLKQLRNGDIYKGRYVCNKKNGEGVYHFINADVFEGEFRDDRMDGYGVYTFSHEGRYEGQWRNAVYNGTGAETFAKGSTYHGEYAGGLRNGWGVCRFYNGDYYEGQWAKGLRDGSGMQQCTDDSNFVGDYHRGKRHGHGVYSFPNGDRYEGQYSEDLPHGHGTYHFASGQCYQGQWQQGKKHGWSVYTVDNGSRFMGLWSEGKPTWVQPLTQEATATAAAGTDEAGRALRQAMEARDLAVQTAAEARKRAAGHWEVGGATQTKLQTALSQACSSAGLAQQGRRKACDLAARLDSAVALLQTQGGGAPVASTTP